MLLPGLLYPDNVSRRQATPHGRLRNAASEGFSQAWGHDQFEKQRKIAKALMHKRAAWEGLLIPAGKQKALARKQDKRDELIASQQRALKTNKLQIKTIEQFLEIVREIIFPLIRFT